MSLRGKITRKNIITQGLCLPLHVIYNVSNIYLYIYIYFSFLCWLICPIVCVTTKIGKALYITIITKSNP